MELDKEHIRNLLCFHQKKNVIITNKIIYSKNVIAIEHVRIDFNY